MFSEEKSGCGNEQQVGGHDHRMQQSIVEIVQAGKRHVGEGQPWSQTADCQNN
jgi:hypothetical protein